MSKQQPDLTSQKVANRSLRLALIVSEHTVYEYLVFLEHLLAGLVDESIPAVLICPATCDVESVIFGAVEVIRYPAIKLPLMEPYNRNRLIEQLAEFRPTVLHCLCESQAGLAKHLARRLDLPYVLMVNSLRNQYNPAINCGPRVKHGAKYLAPSFTGGSHFTWGFLTSKHCAKIIVPAKSIAANMTKAYPRFAERIEQINIGAFVEPHCVCFSNPSRLASMVIAHSLDRVVDFENLFGALRHLAINGYEFMLVVIGTGRAERQLRKLLAALDLSHSVTIVGRLKPWRSILAAGDIFIQPQPDAAFNPFLLEAMSVGSAVAACKGEVDDLIIEGRTAVVFDPNDEISIRSCLQRLFDRKEFARQLAKEAQQYVRDNHSVNNMISATLRTYREAEQWPKR
ncbi:MAG: glycosyltransferase family 4 protein [Sedimentisphaerales bacterium]